MIQPLKGEFSLYVETTLAFLGLDFRVLDSGNTRVRRTFVKVFDKLLELLLRALSFPFHLQNGQNNSRLMQALLDPQCHQMR